MTQTPDLPTSVHALPVVRGPHDLPELRQWLMKQWRPDGPLSPIKDQRFINHNLPAAQLWWVEPDTCDLLAASAPTFPDDAPLDFEDVPTPCGFAVFAHDLIGTDADPCAEGRDVYVSAVLWAPAVLLTADLREYAGISMTMFSRLVLDDGLTPHEMRFAVNDLGAIDDDLSAKRIGPEVTEQFVLTGHLFAYIGRTDWFKGWTTSQAIVQNPHGPNDYTMQSMTEDRKLLAALWALVRSPVVTSVRTKPPRHIARRSERKGLESTVRVLRLGGEHRENIAATSASSTVDWKHQWVVSPHWRWQPYGPRDEGKRRLTLVGPYTKGPADKPLLGGDRVWRVVPPKDAS